MFYSDVILSKKGKLSKVWLAAHAERRMTKAMILDTDIVQSVSTIINKRDERAPIPLALRLSGQLLFGVVRIYSRQAKYLLDDCNDAIMKLKTAFRAGLVDMTSATSHSAITLAPRPAALDLLLPDPAYEGWDTNSVSGGDSSRHTPRSFRAQSYTARPEDITLPRLQTHAEDDRFADWTATSLFDPDGGAVLNLEGAPNEPQRRDSQGRLVDANGDVIESDDSSVGVGRDAPAQAGRPSLGIGEITDDFGGFDFPAMGEGALDLGLEEFQAERLRSSTPAMQSSNLLQDLTPRTALKVQQAAERRAAAVVERKRKQIVDSRTELQDPSTRPAAASRAELMAALAQERYLPRSKAYMQLLDFHANPAKHILPFSTAGQQSTMTGLKGFAPQLNELFTFDASALRRQRSPSPPDEERGSKRLRSEPVGDELSMEVARRAERSSVFGDVTGLAPSSFGDFGGDDEPAFDVLPDLSTIHADITAGDTGLRRSERRRVTEAMEARAKVNPFDLRGELPRLATPSVAGDTQGSVYDSPTSSNLLRGFYNKAMEEPQGLSAQASAQAAASSKHTAMAIKAIRKGLQSEGGQAAISTAELSFHKATADASRRAVAGFFFELLVLGTQDKIEVDQQESFGDIKIKARPTLWDDELV